MSELRLDTATDKSVGRIDTLLQGFQGNSFIEKVFLTGSFLKELAESDCAILREEIGARLPMLRELFVSNAAIQVKQFYKVLDLSESLETFDLRHVQLLGDHNDFTEFEFGLHRHPSLRHFRRDDFTAPPGTSLDNLIKVLGSVPHVESVDIDVHPDRDHCPVITGSNFMQLCKHITFKELHLSHIKVDPLGCSMIAWALVNATLTGLSLSHCQLTDAAVSGIAKALVCNSSLRHLDLSHNEITDAGFSALADALIHNHFLKQLDLTGCEGMTREGHDALTCAMERNHVLEHLLTPFGKENRAVDKSPQPPRRQRSLIV